MTKFVPHQYKSTNDRTQGLQVESWISLIAWMGLLLCVSLCSPCANLSASRLSLFSGPGESFVSVALGIFWAFGLDLYIPNDRWNTGRRGSWKMQAGRVAEETEPREAESGETGSLKKLTVPSFKNAE